MSPGPVKPGLALELELELEQKLMEKITKVPGNLREFWKFCQVLWWNILKMLQPMSALLMRPLNQLKRRVLERWPFGSAESHRYLPSAGYQFTRHRFKASQRQGGWFLDFGPVPATWLAGSCHVRNEIEAGFLGPKIIRNRKQASRERGCWGRPVFFLRLGWCPPHDLSFLKEVAF